MHWLYIVQCTLYVRRTLYTVQHLHRTFGGGGKYGSRIKGRQQSLA